MLSLICYRLIRSGAPLRDRVLTYELIAEGATITFEERVERLLSQALKIDLALMTAARTGRSVKQVFRNAKRRQSYWLQKGVCKGFNQVLAEQELPYTQFGSVGALVESLQSPVRVSIYEHLAGRDYLEV